MRKMFMAFLVFGTAFLTSAAEFELKAVSGPRVDSVVASCNGKPILLSDVLKESSSAEMSIYAASRGDEAAAAIMELRKKVIDQIIDRRLIKADFEQKKMQLPEQFVENMLDDFAAANGCRTRSELEAKVRAGGMTMEKLRDDARERIIYQAMVAAQATRKVYISPRRLHEYYEAGSDSFSVPDKLELSLIRVGRSREDRSAVLALLAQDMRDNRSSFGELAKLYSDGPKAAEGGGIGSIAKPQLRADFASALADTAVGRVAGPLELEDGTYYLLVTGYTPGSRRPFREVAEEIRLKLEKEEHKKAYDEYVGKLREAADVQYYY